MGFQLLVLLQVILSLWPIKASESQNCNTSCGNVSIQYPYGIGDKSCYFDKWFEVTCPDSEKPILTSINLEISDNISVNYYSTDPLISVKIPLRTLETDNYFPYFLSNLSGSPYSISSTYNRFTATGCPNSTSVNQIKMSFMTDECLSVRTCDPKKDSGRYDFHCTIPPGRSFADNDASTAISKLQRTCESAFIVDREGLESNYVQTSTSALKDVNYVPARLEWGKIKGICSEYFYPNYKVCNKDNYCLVQFKGDGHYCLCDERLPDLNYYQSCWGTLICNTSSVNNCSQCPEGYSGSDGGWCYPSYFDRRSRVKLFIITGCSSGLGLLLLLIAAWRSYKCIKRRKAMKKKQKFFKRNGGLLLQQHMPSNESNLERTKLFTSKELEKATDNYSANRILGQGGQGTVFKGMLDEGRIVAVKRSKIVDESKLEEFINEVVILSRINHRNVVQLLGCCLETEVPLLIYEFIPNGTLFQCIHSENEEFPITWELRLRIATEVAHALSYLHSSASIPIYHRDVKSTNILLDDKYRAKVSDFGTSRSVMVDQTHLTTQVQGTFGYMDPEYFRSSQFTEKSDVYSFGVVLAELLTGQKPIRSTINSEEDRSLAAYFLRAMKEDCLFEILDSRVVKEGEKEEVLTVANLTRRCLNLNGKKRPTMREVANELSGIKASNEASILLQNREEIDWVDGGISTSHFDTCSSLAGSFLDSATFSIDQVDPLISNRWN